MWQKCLHLIRMTMSADKSDSHDLSLKQAKYSASKHARYCTLLDHRHNLHIILARPVSGEKFNRSGLLPFLKSSVWPSRELILGRIMAAGEPRGGFIRLGTRTTSRNGGFKVPYFRVSLPLFSPPVPLDSWSSWSAEFRAPVIARESFHAAGPSTAIYAFYRRQHVRARAHRVAMTIKLDLIEPRCARSRRRRNRTANFNRPVPRVPRAPPQEFQLLSPRFRLTMTTTTTGMLLRILHNVRRYRWRIKQVENVE